MAKLGELAQPTWSKNAGPLKLTFDTTFSDEATYRRVRDSRVVDKEVFSKLCSIPKEDILLVKHDAALAIKVSIQRPVFSGEPEDADTFGGQQYGPPVEFELPD